MPIPIYSPVEIYNLPQSENQQRFPPSLPLPPTSSHRTPDYLYNLKSVSSNIPSTFSNGQSDFLYCDNNHTLPPLRRIEATSESHRLPIQVNKHIIRIERIVQCMLLLLVMQIIINMCHLFVTLFI